MRFRIRKKRDDVSGWEGGGVASGDVYERFKAMNENNFDGMADLLVSGSKQLGGCGNRG